jgi:hypothetical protein
LIGSRVSSSSFSVLTTPTVPCCSAEDGLIVYVALHILQCLLSLLF